ncbi:hypothetical protein OSB04_020538 [Centaurea solstitialis]|uniref:Fe2OG dioxygenase domain-containing protein n=1 Tax=Centaurea solstitialis TaxID=347529 RepID=A0AA38SSF3_9ASTR|nr:hypothetical protein OSB04_020538 [Centaurea solstitialis]
MEKLVSSWCNSVKSVPQDYVFPEYTRPGDQTVPILTNCPIIDMEKAASGDRNDIIRQVLQASKDLGFFQILDFLKPFRKHLIHMNQVINHGVSKDLIDETMGIVEEFFDIPNEDKASLYSFDPQKSCRLYTSSFKYATEPIHLWRDVLIHFCHPLDQFIDTWPKNPSNYRDVMGKFSIEVRNLSLRILEMISEGLELKPGYFGDELAGEQMITLNHYPPCPDPSLALGITKHSDRNIMTILYQEKTCGFEVLKDGQWFGVEPYANAFVVNIGQQLKVISNGKLESVEHRVVTNSKEPRYTIASFTNPRSDTIIGPEKALVEKDNCHPLYRAFRYKDYLQAFEEHEGESDLTLEVFKIKG